MRKPAIRRTARLFLTALGFAIVAGCATTTVPTAGPDLAGPERQAQAYAAAGDTAAALAIYSQLYGRSTGTARAQYAIAAADLSIAMGAGDDAREWLIRAETDAGPVQRPWLVVLSAALTLLDGDAATALTMLDGLTEPMERSLSVRAMASRGRALFQLARIEEAVTLLVERDLWLDSDAEILANHELIWTGLQAQTFVRPVIATRDPVVDGWLALAPVAVATRSDPFSLAQGLDRWIAAYPRHPAAEFLLPALRDRVRDKRGRDRRDQVHVLFAVPELDPPGNDAFFLIAIDPHAEAQRREVSVTAYVDGVLRAGFDAGITFPAHVGFNVVGAPIGLIDVHDVGRADIHAVSAPVAPCHVNESRHLKFSPD